MQIVDSLLQVRSSKGIAKDYTPSNSIPTPATFALSTFLDMMRNDPIISTCMDITTEAVTANGYYFYPAEEGDEDQAKEAKFYFDDVLNFDIEQDNIVNCLFLFGDCAVEMRSNSRKVNEVHALEMTELAIDYDSHGEILRFIQNPNSQKRQEWPASDVMFIQMRRIGSKVESYYPLESISVSYSNLIYGNNYLLNIFKNLPPKLLYVLENADRATRKDFINNLRLGKVDPGVDLVINGKADVKNISYDFKSGLLEVLHYLRSQVLMITRVPPVWVGIVDDGNRSNSEASITAFDKRVLKIQQRIASAINRDLLPKCSFNKVYFKYHNPSFKMEKEVLENAERLKNMGLNPVALARYLNNRGIYINENEITEEPTADKDLMPSRNRKDRSTQGVTNKLNSSGNSDESGKKMQQRWVI